MMLSPVVPQAGSSQLNAELSEVKKAGNVPQKKGTSIFVFLVFAPDLHYLVLCGAKETVSLFSD